MANAGRVLSRTMILEHVWDQSFDGATNIVDVYVRHLGAKVDDAHEPKLIRTIRGLGTASRESQLSNERQPLTGPRVSGRAMNGYQFSQRKSKQIERCG